VNATVFAEILASLDLVVFERLPDGVFLRVGPALPPGWFSRLFLHAAPESPIPVADAFPFLEGFLSTTEAAWRRGNPARLRSDLFTMADPAGGEIDLVASAIAIEHRRFLVLEASPDFVERRRLLQQSREHALAHEDHVRHTGALLTPVNAAHKLAQQLAAESSFTAEQQRLASALREQLASIAGAIETLAPLPKGVAPGRR
jgi:hypothetical protein